jgi:hypothetical protein
MLLAQNPLYRLFVGFLFEIIQIKTAFEVGFFEILAKIDQFLGGNTEK